MKKIGKIFLSTLLCSSMLVVPNYKVMAQENGRITNISASGKAVVIMKLIWQLMEIRILII